MSDSVKEKTVKKIEGEAQSVAKTQTAKSSAQENEVSALKKQLKEQGDQIALLLELIKQNNQVAAAPVVVSSNPYGEMIKIVHLVQRAPGLTTYIELSNLVISMSDFGEERTVTVQQFEEMVGKYRNWFNSGMISVAAGYEQLAQHYGLKTAKDYPVTNEFIKNLGTMDMRTLEDIYPRLPESGKDFIVSYWVRKAIEKDPKFRDIYKLETLNRLSEGACSQILADIHAEPKKEPKK